MATVVRLTEEQIDRLLETADEIEQSFKDIYEQLENEQLSESVLLAYRKMHNRYSTGIKFLKRQRELAADDT